MKSQKKEQNLCSCLYKNKKLAEASSYPMRREGLEPSRPKAVTGSLVLRVCQFRHPRVDYFTSISTFTNFVNTFFRFFSVFLNTLFFDFN